MKGFVDRHIILKSTQLGKVSRGVIRHVNVKGCKTRNDKLCETYTTEKRRRKRLPLEHRLAIYPLVLRLGMSKGLKPKEIQTKIKDERGTELSQDTVRDWLKGIKSPYTQLNKFDEEPSPALAFVIGTRFTDGCIYIQKKEKSRIIWLGVKDYEYAVHFKLCLERLFSKKIALTKRPNRWVVKIRSFLLYKFLDRPLEYFKPYVEHCRECTKAFLRACFDAEASLTLSGKMYKDLNIYNTNLKLLHYIRYLLQKYFHIETCKPRISVKKGNLFRDPTGKIYFTKKNCYCIRIHKKSLPKLLAIGFDIREKQKRLKLAIQNEKYKLDKNVKDL